VQRCGASGHYQKKKKKKQQNCQLMIFIEQPHS
jgi:hypothetical protein